MTARSRAVISSSWGASVAALVALALVVAAVTPARAHEADRRLRSVVTEVTVDVPGLVVQVGSSVAEQLLVENPGDTELEILDGDGRAYLRIGPDGVFGDLETAAFHLSNDPLGVGQVPPTADGEAPRWGRLSREPAWGWFDHRLHPVERSAPARAGTGDVLATWSVPVRAGSQEGEIRGRVEFQPVLGGYRATLDDGPTVAEGVTATVLDGPVPALLIQNDGGRPVVVIGAEGEPFLRITADHVEANLASPTWHRAARLEAGRPSPEVAPDATADPAWERIADVPRITWLELRAHVADAAPADPSREAVARRWTIPVVVGDEQVELTGTTTWVPVGGAHDDGSDPTLPVAVLAVALVGAAAALRRRRTVSR